MNKKHISFDNLTLLKLFIGIVFLSAGAYRIFFFEKAISEFSAFGLPIFFIFATIALELFFGLSFILDKYVREATITAMIFLVIALLTSIFTNFSNLILTADQLFIFNPDLTDFVLHLFYLLMLYYIFTQFSKKKTKTKKKISAKTDD